MEEGPRASRLMRLDCRLKLYQSNTPLLFPLGKSPCSYLMPAKVLRFHLIQLIHLFFPGLDSLSEHFQRWR